jgi:lysozyme
MNETRLRGAAGAVTAIGLLAVAVIGNWEGLRLYAYRDVIGVWTACYGETRGIHRGMRFTKEQCDVLFIDSLAEHEKGMRSCLNNPDSLPDKTYVAFLSLAYNIGTGAFCRSSVAREANNLHLVAACNNILKFNKAGGKVVKGLVKRRAMERKLCLEGVNHV